MSRTRRIPRWLWCSTAATLAMLAGWIGGHRVSLWAQTGTPATHRIVIASGTLMIQWDARNNTWTWPREWPTFGAAPVGAPNIGFEH